MTASYIPVAQQGSGGQQLDKVTDQTLKLPNATVPLSAVVYDLSSDNMRGYGHQSAFSQPSYSPMTSEMTSSGPTALRPQLELGLGLRARGLPTLLLTHDVSYGSQGLQAQVLGLQLGLRLGLGLPLVTHAERPLCLQHCCRQPTSSLSSSIFSCRQPPTLMLTSPSTSSPGITCER